MKKRRPRPSCVEIIAMHAQQPHWIQLDLLDDKPQMGRVSDR